MGDIKFPVGSVPVKVATQVYGKNECWVRVGIIAGWLPIGKAIRNVYQIWDSRCERWR